ncbi:hypothetical protein IAD21_02649 [Abditibacteriota bacterium]|nr:hypothetical protein IAD21_02649 [Abditibacteriota bacterium]
MRILTGSGRALLFLVSGDFTQILSSASRRRTFLCSTKFRFLGMYALKPLNFCFGSRILGFYALFGVFIPKIAVLSSKFNFRSCLWEITSFSDSKTGIGVPFV